MNTIKFLIPTDFSGNARNAAGYAIELAKKINGSLYFLHVIPSITGDSSFLSVDKTSIVKESSLQLKEWYFSLNQNHQLKFHGASVVGDITKTIVQTAEDQHADFIVMGTRGASGLKRLFLGSHAASVIEESALPVLVVPEDSSYSTIKKIIYATDYENSDIDALKKIVSLAKVFDAKIEIIHVSEEHSSGGTELSIIDYFSELVQKSIPYPKISYKVFENENTAEGIEQFVRTAEADMLALNTRRRSGVKKIFEKSLTKALAYHAKLPLLSFHTPQEVNKEKETVLWTDL